VIVVSHAGIVFKLIPDISRFINSCRVEIPLPVSDDKMRSGFEAILSCVNNGKFNEITLVAFGSVLMPFPFRLRIVRVDEFNNWIGTIEIRLKLRSTC